MPTLPYRTLAVLGLLAAPAAAQQGGPALRIESCSHIVIPQSRGFALNQGDAAIRIESVAADVKILEQAAATTLDVTLRNPGRRQAEAVLLLPVPDGAAVSGFSFDGPSPEPTARLLPADEARRLYEAIVAKIRDPALLEFAGFRLIRTSVFPVPPGGTQRLRLNYEQVLPADGPRVDYVLPRSESLDDRCPWRIVVDVSSKSAISTVYSPSHDIRTRRLTKNRVLVETTSTAALEPGPFLLSVLREGDAVTASLFSYPDPKVRGGYFLLVAGLPADLAAAQKKSRLAREVIVVVDRSGSMAGLKMDQVRAAALQVIEGLEDGEAFNIVDYSSAVSLFAPRPVVKDAKTTADARAYLASLRPTGGTNIHDALLEALRQEKSQGSGKRLPIVLFLTDGLPTVGRTAEKDIREMVEKANASERRIFTFGVGSDVNAPLLDRVAEATRARSTYVLPGEDVEVKVGNVFQQLFGPVLAAPVLETVDEGGALTTRRVREVVPSRMPDLFEGDQLVVLGQYAGDRPLSFRLRGDFLGAAKAFTFEFDLATATTRNAFVPRLWASRRIAELVDQIRQAGAEVASGPLAAGSTVFTDPKLRELTDEIVRLSTEFGVLSEYTSFLATEGAALENLSAAVDTCRELLDTRAVGRRSGDWAVNQSINIMEQKSQTWRNYSNGFLDEKLNRVEVAGVRQVCDRTFFRRGSSWIDANVLPNAALVVPDEVIEFGTEAHGRLVDALVKEGRPGLIMLPGDIFLKRGDKTVLVKNPGN